MIDKAFWEKVAGDWKKADDGIIIPPPDDGGAGEIIDDDPFGDLSGLDIDDILGDFDI